MTTLKTEKGSEEGKTFKVLRQTDFCFVAEIAEGVQFGILQMASRKSSNPAIVEAANAAVSIPDDDDFDDAVSVLFRPANC